MRITALIVSLLASFPALATDFSGSEVFIPVVTRVPGANGTQWHTDLIITNRSTRVATQVSTIYDPAGPGEGVQRRYELAPRQTITLRDAVLSEYGVQVSYGTLWVGSNNGVDIAAHARIYNSGNPAGEFGQMLQGLPLDQLSKTQWLHGMNGTGGNRTNVGIGNPNNTPLQISLTWYDKDGEMRGGVSGVVIQPWDVLLLNDIFGYLAMPYDEALTLRLFGNLPFHSYASVVRNDTGDAYTILGNGSDE